MRDDPHLKVITYARACQILNVTPGNLRVMVHRGKFTHPQDCAGQGYLLEIEVLREEAARRNRHRGHAA